MESTTHRRILRMKDLPPKVGLQPSTLYGLIAEGKFLNPTNWSQVAVLQAGTRLWWTHGSLSV